MKTLVLIRHAEAEEQLSGQSDFERRLTDAGRAMAARTATELFRIQPGIVRIIASAAVRTSQTAEILRQTFTTAELVQRADLYQASRSGYLSVLHELMSDDENSAILIGHNPAIGNLMCTLSGQSISVTPATAAVLERDADSWIALRSDIRCRTAGLISEGRLIVPGSHNCGGF